MPTQLTAAAARQSLTAHVAAKGAEIFERHGPRLGWKQLRQILADPDCVRYPCSIQFDASGLGPGEFAHPFPRGERPEDGFVIHVHPLYMTQLDAVPLLVLYQLVLVNYGAFASAADAETFGACALGLPRETYYQRVCALADLLAGGC